MKELSFFLLLIFSSLLVAEELKQAPPNSPMFYYHIAESTYRDDPQAYLDSAFGKRRIEVLDQAVAGAHWKFILMLDLKRNRPIVSFRGTVDKKGWCANLRHAVKKPRLLYDEMNQQLDVWQQALVSHGYSPIADLVGHSRGGDFVHHVKKDWLVFRITFNGYHCKKGDDSHYATTLNLRIKNDLFSHRPFSQQQNYLSLGEDNLNRPRQWKKIITEIHLLRNFALISTKTPKKITRAWLTSPSPLKEKSWQELLPTYFQKD